jgi:hypothetical protein
VNPATPLAAPAPTAPVTALSRSDSVALERARTVFDPLVTLRVWRLRRQLARWLFPSVACVRFGGRKGLDELLAAEFIAETGAPLPSDISLANLAAARAVLLPRSLARWEMQRLFEQHVIAVMHRLLARDDYDVCRWVRVHYRSVWRRILRRLLRRLGRYRAPLDPVELYRTKPGAFATFVWSRLWALPELEERLEATMPSGDPPLSAGIDSDAVTTAVQVATKLDTEHPGWGDPDRLLRDLYAKIRAAVTLMPEHPMVAHVHERVSRATARLVEFDPAYNLGATLDPLPEWIQAALDAFDATDVRRHGPDQVTKVVRRIACRLWVTGTYPFPQAPPHVPLANGTAQAAAAPDRTSEHAFRVVEDDTDVGF